ncbi:Predicted arabinose efflux permease, MFS family [Cnuella takakiae]|uniref:Predicted arabinose efflux permease, MFS family n=1 Tax=Cnuella takakiae TaxID=1302690 RepID=A0A1M5IPK4_9BACT|nr:MFS transporter [Cnuella takakiae]OLY93945.1 MFS transporter [Cnuella takakiae]SHG30227.1 Predicted arabinose efflux permease, MFS family [Cnuella takakiae]
MNNASPKGIWKVIGASSLGTLIEWYDFYIFGSLATVIASQFFPNTNPTAALLSTLATFAAGFIVRPFGALVFGRLGDLIGRKYTFLLTLVLMGGSTFAIGLVPSYESIGFAAPIIVLLLRLLQGLALGGEYGGAATYVAEHAPANRRGYFTSWIQTTATLGLFVSLGVILITRHSLDADPTVSIAKFNDWGWRIPFLVSIVLVLVSVYIRMKMKESPLFTKLKSEGKVSVNPLKESFGHRANLKMVLLALFGATMGQGVVWYTGQFYAQSFMENVCKIDFEQSRTILIWAILFATPFFVVFGSWSDKIGRKWIILTGMLVAIVTYKPLFGKMLEISTPSEALAASSEVKESTAAIANTTNVLRTQVTRATFASGMVIMTTQKDTVYASSATQVSKPDVKVSKVLGTADYWKMVAIVFMMILYVTMVYGPIAAFLVELFPTKIRYTSMSLPYHIGNGVFGGLTPFVATLLTTIYTSDKLVGLMYPILVAALSLVIGAMYISNKE